jgi:hypothetical protein
MLYKNFPIMTGAGLALLMSGAHCLAQPASPSNSTEATQPGTQQIRPTMRPLAFKLNLNSADMAKITAMMHAGRAMCFVQDLDPGDDSSLIEICGIPDSTQTFVP